MKLVLDIEDLEKILVNQKTLSPSSEVKSIRLCKGRNGLNALEVHCN